MELLWLGLMYQMMGSCRTKWFDTVDLLSTCSKHPWSIVLKIWKLFETHEMTCTILTPDGEANVAD